ncbi:recombinase family protein [Paraburkholderia kururiensis]|uniref:recombinase family protein n=2 Tax=Paraburkholderia kururiensis TaxID=984307 RepID=UPI000F8975CE|nr:recombinase family protein [Paraburkholderia kururiensis]
MLAGYARVSTDEQHLDLQLAALTEYGCKVIFRDHGCSGVDARRPGLLAALEALGPGDTFVVWRLDRLGRSLADLIDWMARFSEQGVRFVSLTESIDTTSPTGRFMFHMIAALAEFERGLITERTRAGLAAARERGRAPGRPAALTANQLAQARALLATEPLEAVARHFNVHRHTLRRHLRRTGTG